MPSPSRPRRRTSSGRPTSPTSRSQAGGGSTFRRSSTTSPATSLPGSSAPACASGMSPTRWSSPWQLRDATPRESLIGPGCSATTDRPTSQATSRDGSSARASPTYGGAPNHPQTQGKIERWHQTLKNRILLENYFLPGQLELAVGAFVDHYNHHRHHESPGNLTPADVYFGRGPAILAERKKIKKLTIQSRRLSHHARAA
jgi:hypothetical protein